MVIDSSALPPILQNEPERRPFNEAIEAAATRLMSVANFVEVSIVMEVRHGAEGVRDVDQFIEKAGIELIEVTADQGHRARRAYARYGRGRHRANLNYGDCFAYALADARAHRRNAPRRAASRYNPRLGRPS
jgi:ribonuclease VapC